MNAPPSRWRDGWLMFRYRQRTVCLSAWRWHVGATGGEWLRLLLHGDRIPRAVHQADGWALIAWGEVPPGEPTGWLTHVAPAEALPTVPLTPLVERLARRAAQGGARYLATETPEDSPWPEALRRAGMLPVTRWLIWRWAPVEAAPTERTTFWTPLNASTLGAAQALFRQRVPPSVRSVLPQPRQGSTWWVYHHPEGVRGVAWLRRGPRGIWIALFLHPDADDRRALLTLLAQRAVPRYAPAWICALPGGAESAVAEDLGAAPQPGWLLLSRPVAAPIPATALQPERAGVPQPLRPLAPPSS